MSILHSPDEFIKATKTIAKLKLNYTAEEIELAYIAAVTRNSKTHIIAAQTLGISIRCLQTKIKKIESIGFKVKKNSEYFRQL